MNRNNYDDWNSSVPDSGKPSSGTVLFNARKNSGCMMFSFCILLILGLISLYSSSYTYARYRGLNQFDYVLKQLIFIAVGLIGALMIFISSRKFLEIICPILMLSCLITCIVTLVFKTSLLSHEVSAHAILIIQDMYLSLFFANRPDGIKKLRELFLPIVFSVVILIAVLTQNSFTYGILFIVLTIVLFACGGVGFGGVMLLVFFAILPITVWILSSSANIKILLSILVPGYINSNVSDIALNARTAISNGGLWGVGMGNGTVKAVAGSGFFREYIFCNVAEESGFIGVFVVISIFAVIIYCSFRSAGRLRNVNRFYSNFTCGLSLIFTGVLFLNLCAVLDILPVSFVNMPFFSYSPNMIATICECALIYKMSKDNILQDSNSEDDLNSIGNFEVDYESENV